MIQLQLFNDYFTVGDSAFSGRMVLDLLVRLAIDLVSVFLIVRRIYCLHPFRGELQFTLFSMNLIIFILSFLLHSVEMTMGAAFGLFAVFSMLRYRTENISARDMTYVFIVIALGLLTAVSAGGWLDLLFISTVITLGIWFLENGMFLEREQVQHIVYDKIDLIKPDRREELIADLRDRTGLPITRIDIGQIDLLKDAVHISVYYINQSPKGREAK